MDRLAGKVAIVTGAAQGMGAAHARLFVAEGAKVIMTDLNERDGQTLADDLGDNALFIRQDVADRASWETVVREGEARFGSVNVLVANAGVIGKVVGTIDMSLDDYNFVCSVNQTAVFLGIQAVLPSMIKSGVGSIVNISSIAGIISSYGLPNIAYAASKFAVRGMTKAIAAEFGSKNIRCNSIHPGFVKTPMMVDCTDEGGGDALSMIPMHRMAEPVEVSNLAVFLASDESSFITGVEHIIDGGMTAI
jgi:3alpha(or 20beta)-hydroxysteroid dehydrogenase